MENEVTIQTVKRQVDENNELIGYLVDSTRSVPLDDRNRDYQMVKQYIEDGGVVEEAYLIEELDSIRIAGIKAKAQELILAAYPMYKQNNVPMSGIQADIDTMNNFMTNIRNISNEADANNTALIDIVW